MNGATAEPWARTSRPPSTTLITMIGSSQNLRRAPRNFHIWTTKSMGRYLLVHVPETVVGRTGRVALHPIALGGGVELARHGVAPDDPHHHAGGGKDAEKDHPENDRADDGIHERAELHPGAVERRQPRRAGQGDDREQAGQGEQPRQRGAAAPDAEGADEEEEPGEGPAEGTIGRKLGRHRWVKIA